LTAGALPIRLTQLSHIKAQPRFRCFLAHRRDQAVQAKTMDPQRDLAVSRSVIIVVDDDPAVRNSLKFSLEIEGFLVHLYASGTELLGERDIPHCSCLVVDQKMPGIPGLDLISKLREQAIWAPAILITSHPTAELARRAAGANVTIVEKPLLGNALMERIRDACGQSGNGPRL
jgi:FixJ family two-component response regulator